MVEARNANMKDVIKLLEEEQFFVHLIVEGLGVR